MEAPSLSNGAPEGQRSTRARGAAASRGDPANDSGPWHLSRKHIEDAKRLAHRIEGLGLQGLDQLADRMFGKPLSELASLEASSLIETLRAIEAGKIDVFAALRGAA